MQKEDAFRLSNRNGFIVELKKKNYVYDEKKTKAVSKQYKGKEYPLGWLFDLEYCSILLVRHLKEDENKLTKRASSTLVKLAENFW